MPPAVIGGLALLTSKVIAAKTLAIGFAVAFKTFATGALITFASSKLMEEFAKKPSRPDVGSASSGVAGSTRGLTGSVIPKRWILGRARVTGGLVMFREDGNYLRAVMVLSAGSIDEIERVWAHGDEVEMERNGNVLVPVSDSRYYGTREETYEEEYEVETPPDRDGGGGGDGPPSPTPTPRPSLPDQGYVDLEPPPGGEGGDGPSCGNCSQSFGSAGPGSAGSGRPALIHDGRFEGVLPSQPTFGRSLDLSPWALARYNEAVMGTSASAGAMASASGEQGEGGGETAEERAERLRNEEEARRRAIRTGIQRVTRTRRVTRTVSVPLIKITEFFDADGSSGQAVADILGPAGEGELEWTAAHAGNDVSYVVVEFYQPDYGNEIDDRFWPGIPQMEFLVRGLKVQYPVADETMPNGRQLTEPAWTRNAAVLRYWYLTQRRNVDPLLIDLPAFTAARLLCDEDIQLTTQSGYQSDYPETVKRYTVDGSITSGDSAAQLDVQFDFAWQGFVIQHSGSLIFRPGTDMPARFTITEDDILTAPVISPFSSRADLANEISVDIEQSSGSEYKAENFVVVDSNAQASDGERLPQEMSRLLFVTEPVQVVNLITQRLRQQRGLVGVQLQIKSPTDWRYHTLIAGDKVELVLPEHGIGVDGANLRNFRVTALQVNDDYSINITLLEWPSNLFDDTFDFPPRQQKFSYALRALPAPVGRGIIDWNLNRDGAVVWTAFLSWQSNPYETIVSVDSPGSNVKSQSTFEKSISLDLTDAGRYTFNLHHRDRTGLRSPQSQVVLNATFAGVPLPKPVIESVEQNANIIVFQIENVPNRDIDGVDVRYRSLGLGASFVDVPGITESEWEDAPQMNVSPIVPPNENTPIYATAVVPASGTYRLYVRLHNRVGNLSPLSNVYDLRLEIPASATGSYASQPQWGGDLKNALRWPFDNENRIFTNPSKTLATTSFDDWNGVNDFPFGEHTGYGIKQAATGDKTTYTTLVRNFDTAARREISVAIESVSPAGLEASDPAGFEITLMHSASEDLANPTSIVVADGAPTNLPNVRSVQAVVNFYNQRSHALIAVTLGWREVV